MKRQITLLTIIIVLSGLCVRSQTLYNTKWSVYDTSSTFLVYFNFGTDTLSYSTDNVSYTNIATFSVSSNNFTIVDLSAATCPLSDTGRYTFLIQSDTLKYTLISDLCTSRSETFVTFHWVALLTGTETANQLSKNIFVYPNPFSNETTLQTDNLLKNATLTVENCFG